MYIGVTYTVDRNNTELYSSNFPLLSTSQLQNHVNCTSSGNVIFLKCLLIAQLLSTEDKSNLVYLDAFLFLECLLDSKNSRLSFKVVLLLAPCESFNKDLHC
mmetsp:Transcript_16563/g.29038  ORF Transcript_16563/g.29038 Transcript_16563/m.29038 type:complete len:102 (-) Transcript_16563:62-367(-)